MTKTVIARTALVLATVLWMGVIFLFSAEPSEKSTGTSDSVIEGILSATVQEYDDLDRAEQKELIGSYSLLTRKLAHFTAYLVLGVLLSLTLISFGIKDKRCFITGLLLCALYAVSDEVHQYFVPGRACRLLDVLIDSSGSAAGAGAVYLIRMLFLRRRKPPTRDAARDGNSAAEPIAEPEKTPEAEGKNDK